MTDAVIQRIEDFRCDRGALFAERRNRGYTLYDASPVRQSRACVQLGPTTDLKSSTGRSGKSDRPQLVLSAAPSCRSVMRCSLSLTRIFSGS